MLILGDLNTRFSRMVHTRIGEYVWPSQSSVPQPLYDILQKHDLWVPATFAGCHWGPHETWFPPSGAGGSRIDYIIPSVAWAVSENGSYVLQGIDFGQTSVDHFGVCLHVTCRLSGAGGAVRGHAKLDQAKMATKEGQAAIRAICDSAPMFP